MRFFLTSAPLFTRFDARDSFNVDLAVIFRPAVLNHPAHEMSHEHHKLSQEVLEFLIKHQDWFMLDIPPPPRSDSLVTPAEKGSPIASKSRNPFSSASRLDKPMTTSNADQTSNAAAAAITDDLNMYVGPVSDEEEEGGWRVAGSVIGNTLGRRRTFSEIGSPRRMSDEHVKTMADGRRSAENITTSSSAPNSVSVFKNTNQHLTPVRESSTGDMDAMVADPSPSIEGGAVTAGASAEQNAANHTVSPQSSTRPTAVRQGTAASSVEGGADGLSTREKRAKFDDEKLAKNDEVRRDAEKEKERRGRSGTKASALWGSVRRSRTVEGTTSNSSGTKTPPERHVLKKRNSKGEVEKVDR